MSNTFRPSAAVKHTVIEEGTDFKGSLTSSCPIDVRGRIEGEVTTPALTVSTSGSVRGRAKVGSVRSEGELSGEFDAETVELAGNVRDKTVIRAKSLEVKLASERGQLQVIFGETELAIGDEPTEFDRVEPVVEKPAALALEVAPMTVQSADEPAAIVDLPAVPSAEIAAEGDDEADDAQASDATAAEPTGKRRRKKKDAQPQEEAAEIRWSHPPSQPPPAN
jgi:cytoskeletal protein CcmA (bactofilin family)